MRTIRFVVLASLLASLVASLVACDDGDGDSDGGVLFPGIDAGTVGPGDPCNGTIDCTPGSICFSNICVQDGTLRFSLAWEADTDFDLHVLTPAGNEISYRNDSADFGTLDVDDCISGFCRLPDHKHVENVFFTEEAERGEYTYWVRNFDGDTAGAFTLVVAVEGETQATQVAALPAEPVESTRYKFTY